MAISSVTAGWLADAYTAIQQSRYSGGMLGALQNAKRANGSIKSFLYSNGTAANGLASIAQAHVSDNASLTVRAAVEQMGKAQAAKLQESMKALASAPPAPKDLLDPMIFFANGSTFNTVTNVLTRTDGIQIDTTTGLEVIDSASIISLANGAYLDTAKNIMTMPDGTKIDSITGLIISTTA